MHHASWRLGRGTIRNSRLPLHPDVSPNPEERIRQEALGAVLAPQIV
jgi:hypothetical protein